MERIDICTEDDVPAIAEMHSKIKFKNEVPNSEGLRDYYRKIFFHNPWHDKNFSSFVYRNSGKVIGFIGVIPRQMYFRGETIKVAVSHRLMVCPHSGHPFAAAQLIRKFLSGPQDLSLSDGANNMGRKFWEGMGGSTSMIYSMNWIRPLKPCSYAINVLSQQNGRKTAALMLKPAASIFDSLGAAKLIEPVFSSECTSVETDDRTLLDCFFEFSKYYTLNSEYEYEKWKWLMDFLRSNQHRGSFKAFAVYKGAKELIGAYACYQSKKRINEVILLLARRDSRNKVLQHMLSEAKKDNVMCLWGRVEPKFIDSLGSNRCLFKQGSWALIHTKRPEIIETINSGEAFLTALEGELWLRSPNDIL